MKLRERTERGKRVWKLGHDDEKEGKKITEEFYAAKVDEGNQEEEEEEEEEEGDNEEKGKWRRSLRWKVLSAKM